MPRMNEAKVPMTSSEETWASAMLGVDATLDFWAPEHSIGGLIGPGGSIAGGSGGAGGVASVAEAFV